MEKRLLACLYVPEAVKSYRQASAAANKRGRGNLYPLGWFSSFKTLALVRYCARVSLFLFAYVRTF